MLRGHLGVKYMRILWYDRQGKPLDISNLDWVESKLCNINYKRVAETILSDGKWISTVWLGLDYSFMNGPPLIFETMVFESKDDLSEIDCERYSTENEAILGHEEMVKKYEPRNK